jgi:hypothetical protein
MMLELVIAILIALVVGVGIGRTWERRKVFRMKQTLNAMYGRIGSDDPRPQRFVGENLDAYTRRLRSFYQAGPS